MKISLAWLPKLFIPEFPKLKSIFLDLLHCPLAKHWLGFKKMIKIFTCPSYLVVYFSYFICLISIVKISSKFHLPTTPEPIYVPLLKLLHAWPFYWIDEEQLWFIPICFREERHIRKLFGAFWRHPEAKVSIPKYGDTETMTSAWKEELYSFILALWCHIQIHKQ